MNAAIMLLQSMSVLNYFRRNNSSWHIELIGAPRIFEVWSYVFVISFQKLRFL